MQDDIWLDQLLEVCFLNFNAIASRRKIRHRVLSDRIGLRLILNVCVRANDCDPGGDDSSLGSVGYAAGEGGVCRLGAEHSDECSKADDREKRPKHIFLRETPAEKSAPLDGGLSIVLWYDSRS